MRVPVRFLGVLSLASGAALTGGLGLLYLLDPEAIREAAGIAPESPSALAEIRSTYGGFHIGIALFLVACSLSERMRRAGLLLCALAFACAGIARIAGIVEFEATDRGQSVTAALEVVFSGISFWLFHSWPAARRGHS
jgi:hypothetical protein